MPISHVYDTFAKSSKGRIMHFDVVLEQKNPDIALNSAKKWLATIGETNAVVNQENCVFCHSAETSEELQQQINAQGYAIYTMEGCPS